MCKSKEIFNDRGGAKEEEEENFYFDDDVYVVCAGFHRNFLEQ